MKQLILINGTMGAGKSAVSNQLLRLLAPSVYLDGDWCWNMNPFVANGENKAMVLDNIAYLLRSFLSNSGYQYVIFCWVIHQEEIFEEIFSRLEGMEYQPVKITLDVSPGALCQRLLQVFLLFFQRSAGQRVYGGKEKKDEQKEYNHGQVNIPASRCFLCTKSCHAEPPTYLKVFPSAAE